MDESNPAVICLSGGLDSTSLLLHLLAQRRNVFGLSFDYGQKHKIELQRLQANLTYLKSRGHNVAWHLVDLSSISPVLHSALTDPNWDVPEGHYEADNMKQTVVPNRNSIFASIAFAYALSISQKLDRSVEICLGVHSGDHAIYPDCRPEFYEAIHRAFQLGNWNSESISLYLPYLNFDKFQILQDAKSSIESLDLEFESIFRNTITSYAPDRDGVSKGLTGSDVERILAFEKLGVADPIEYHDSWESVLAKAKSFENESQQKEV